MSLTDDYKDYCSNFVSTPTTSALNRIGDRLPEEVLGRIVSLIQGGYDYRRGMKEKQDMGLLALTCRYWATQCQPTIFEWIWLRSGKDLDELLFLMASPPSRIASYIKTLWLEQKGPSNAPWLHLVALRLVPKLSLDTINLSLSTVAAIRSIHNALPRSYPSFSSHISQLMLYSAHFNSFADLLHLVDEMPSLQILWCTNVTWPTVPDDMPVVPHQRRCIPPNLQHVWMCACTSTPASLYVLAGRRRKVRASMTAPFDFGLHLHITYNLVFPCAEENATCTSSLRKIDSAYNMIDVHVRSYKFYFIMPSAPGPGNSIVRVEIIAIYIEEYKDGDSDKWNKTCDQLPTLQKLVLGFSSTEDMTHFVREVVNTKLDDLRSADRVKYAVLGENGWSRASSADSEELKETGLRVEDLWRI